MTVNGKKSDNGHATAGATPARRTQAERTATTREALLRAARQLFGEHGFAGTPREDIVERAGVTRGALHHHFGRKEDLFRAVLRLRGMESNAPGKYAEAFYCKKLVLS